jgi:hypothetical protein
MRHRILICDRVGLGSFGPFLSGAEMKVIASLVLLCTLSGVASAQTTQCQSIPKASDRLACYDKALPPSAAGKPAASKTTGPDNKAAPSDQGTVVDKLAVENARLDAKLKTICRGC